MATFCSKCGNPVQENHCFCQECGNEINIVTTPVQDSTGIPPCPPNYLVKSILLTALLFWPVGIAAIVNASKVNSLYYSGKYAEAKIASERANIWCDRCIVWGIISIIVSILWVIFCFLIILLIETI